MKLFTLERTLNGVVTARLEGGLTGRFLSLALEAGIEVWNVRSESGAVLFEVFARDYLHLRPLRRKSQCRLRLVRRRGLPFALRRIRHPIGLASGLALMLAVIYLMGALVMDVRIVGNTALSGGVLMQSLAEHGLREGMWQSEVDGENIVHRVLIDNDALSWITVNPMFGTVEVIVWDKIDKPESGIGPYGSAVRAAADAQITEMEVESGTPVVAKGDVVKQGDLLVVPQSAALGGSWTGSVRAAVWAKTSWEAEFAAERDGVDRTPTGRVQKNYALELFGAPVELPQRETAFRWFDSASYRRPLRLFSVTLPVNIIVTEYAEVAQSARSRTDAELEAVLRDAQRAYEREMLGEREILNRQETYTVTDGGAVLRVEYLCLENIAEYVAYDAPPAEQAIPGGS